MEALNDNAIFLMKFLITFVPILTLLSCNTKDHSAGPAPSNDPLPVQVASPISEEIALTKTYTGRFTPAEKVDVRARVSGYIEEILFKEGEEIKKGDLMFKIDSSLFDAEVARSEAQVEQVKASILLAERSYTRAKDLVKRKAISQEEVDIRFSELTRAKADMQAAKANLQTFRLNRSYADIEAPISGIAGRIEITQGNYITGGNANAPILTTIVSHTPLYCEFEVDEKQFLQFTRMFFDGQNGGRSDGHSEVQIAVSDSDAFEFSGPITFADNELDPSTATLQLRATITNEDKFLSPGLFARVKVPIAPPSQYLLVKDAALGFDQSKRFAWVLQEDNTLERRYVEVGTLQGDLRIIQSGLTKEDKIAISGLQLLRPAFPVQPIEASMK